jgi:hypothetical protein
MAGLTVSVERELKIKFLLIRRQFHFSLSGGFGVALLTFLDFVALFPCILAILIDMMALIAGNLVLRRMQLMGELHRSLGQSGPN